MSRTLTRRTLTRTIAWTAPTAIIVAAGPAFAASSECSPSTATQTDVRTALLYADGTVDIAPDTPDLAVVAYSLGTQTTNPDGSTTASPGGILLPGTSWETQIQWQGVPAGTELPALDSSALAAGLTFAIVDQSVTDPYQVDPTIPDSPYVVDMQITYTITVETFIEAGALGRVSWQPIIDAGGTVYNGNPQLIDSPVPGPDYAQLDSSGACTLYSVTLLNRSARELKIRQ